MDFKDWLELFKTIGAASAITALTLLVAMRDKVKDHDRELYGKDGANGHRGDLKAAKVEIALLKEWRIREEAIAQIEEELMSDVKRVPERLRDKLGRDS
ncbi:MAG: hypothetical protein H0U60_09805 [Blastocatellia bacterium]|nr:hypothetical protein [Blastocatellia bacterium]